MPNPLDARFILAAERKLGATLPDSYRHAMMRANGGSVVTDDDTWWLYPIADDSDSRRFARTWADIVVETQVCRDLTGFPEDAVAIAHNGSGDFLLFRRRGDRFGPEVYEWLHEEQEVYKVEADFGLLERE